jgi:hypothetical protein
VPHINIQNITPLAKLKNLKILDIRWANISEENYQKLKKELPTTIIVRYEKLTRPENIPEGWEVTKKVERWLREMGYIA